MPPGPQSVALVGVSEPLAQDQEGAAKFPLFIKLLIQFHISLPFTLQLSFVNGVNRVERA